MGNSPDAQTARHEFDTREFARRIQKRDLSALSDLHEAFYPRLYRYAFYSLGQHQASQEVAAEAFLKLVGELRQRSVPRDLPTWLFAAAFESVRARIPPTPAGNLPEADSQQDEGGKYGPLFRRSLHKLPPDQQHFLGLRFTQQFSWGQIGSWLSLQEHQLRTLQFCALNALLEALGGKPVLRSEETLERALQVCIQNLESGNRLEELAASYPKWREELYALLEVAHFSQYPGGIDPRQKLQPAAGMEELQAAQGRSREEFLQATQVSLTWRQPTRWLGWLVGWLVAVCLLTTCGAVLTANSARAIPGSPLYSAKQGIEELRLNLTRDPSARLQLVQLYDQRRLEEVQELLRKGQARYVVFSGVLQQDTRTGWQVGLVKLLVSPETEILGSLRPGYTVTVQGSTTSSDQVQANQLQMREVRVQGQVQSLSEFKLQVDGLLVTVTPETIWQGQAKVGDQVVVYLLLPSSGMPEARLVEVLKSG